MIIEILKSFNEFLLYRPGFRQFDTGRKGSVALPVAVVLLSMEVSLNNVGAVSGLVKGDVAIFVLLDLGLQVSVYLTE